MKALVADRTSILYNLLTGFLSSATGWPKSVAKWSLIFSSLISAVSALRRAVAHDKTQQAMLEECQTF